MSAEALFEKYRPKDKPTRRRAFFLGKRPHDLEHLGPTSLDNIYQVTSEGPIHRGDFSWLLKAGMYEMGARYGVDAHGRFVGSHWTPEDERLVRQWIHSYWSGSGSDNARFEYHTPSIHIIKRITP